MFSTNNVIKLNVLSSKFDSLRRLFHAKQRKFLHTYVYIITLFCHFVRINVAIYTSIHRKGLHSQRNFKGMHTSTIASLPHLSFTPNLTTANHYTSVYQILRYIDFNESKSLSFALLSNLPVSHITPVFKSLHWLKVKEGIEYKLLSLTYKVLTTSQPIRIFLHWSLFSLLAVLDPRLLSPYPDPLLPHHSKLPTVLFNLQHPSFGINSLTLSVSLIHILVFHLLTTVHKSDPHCHHHHFHHQLLLFSL